MKRIAWMAVAVGLFAFVAAPALADDTAPTARDIQAAVDSYLASASQDATLVGGPGSAGYDQGFWIRGGDFMLRINLTLQARYEYFDYDKDEEALLFGDPNAFGQNEGFAVPWLGGDLSGFSMPRVTLKFSGEAPVQHPVLHRARVRRSGLVRVDADPHARAGQPLGVHQPGLPTTTSSARVGSSGARADAFNFRMGKIKTPNTRQLMVAPELQQFIDISMASALHRRAAARLHRSQPRLRLHGPRRLRLQW